MREWKYDRVKWSRDLKAKLARERILSFDKKRIREAIYRPFTKMNLYCADGVVDITGPTDEFFPEAKRQAENKAIWIKVGSEVPMFALVVNLVPNLLTQGGSQCFPLYTYSEKDSERRDNITSKALAHFQTFYNDSEVTRTDVFNYVYALLHCPAYRSRYNENLKRELPRIPFIGVIGDADGDAPASFFPLATCEAMRGGAKPIHNPRASANLFRAFVDAGKKLADLHVNYESAKGFPVKRQENREVKLDWCVEAMKLVKHKGMLLYNDFLTLSGIPFEAYDYRLGNRSALEWVIDQYRVTRDENGNIVKDPNRRDDEQYIVRLVGRVIRVSIETMKIVNSLPVFETAQTADDE